MKRQCLLLAMCSLASWQGTAFAQAPLPPTELKDYIDKPEPDYAWKQVDVTEAPAGKMYTLHLVSQKWHGEVWDHDLLVFLPKDVKPTATMVIYNTGGKAGGSANALLGTEIAKRVKAPVAFLFGVPKQPIPEIGGNKKEDALIAETFVRYLDTKDGTWPLLFPMAKSVVKSMDALQAFAKKEWHRDITGFVITGASKRGWTSWLTAASGDKRVKAIAPMVIDTLNFQKQMPHQLKSFGRYSEQIVDYEERKLLPLPDTKVGRKLWSMVDPWVYRETLTLPKMLIHGTNDPYWSQDSTNIYWDDLKGEKYLCYVANAGHGLRPEETPNVEGTKKDPFQMQAVNTLAAFSRHIILEKAMPKLTWKHSDDGAMAKLAVESDTSAKGARGWVATSATRDFRKSKWKSSDIEVITDKAGTVSVTPSATEFTAFFMEIDFDLDGLPFQLSTQIRILEPKK